MKKNRVNEILMAQSKRRSIIIAYSCAIVLVAVLAVVNCALNAGDLKNAKR